jgi:tetratricopeptide (TPR) repeat protein
LNSITAISPVKRFARHVSVGWVAICFLIICLLWPTFASATRQAKEPEAAAASKGDVLLDRWQAEAARQWALEQLAREPNHPIRRFLLGQALFYLGRYQEALDMLDRAIELLPHPHFQAYRKFVAQTRDSIASLQVIETEHFRIYIDPERDAALVPYVEDVLEQSYQRLGTLFDLFPSEKIRVEIFPTTDTFYPASSLSARDIEVSGAIGICKFNKIMLLSPRNLARGYRWTDSLSHEYIHYLLVQLSGNRAPIWLHEGIAKYFEDAWRLPASAWLSRRTESLLAHALKHDSFVGFENMEPSLVKLDTTYQVQLGYAEAASAIDFIMNRRGAKGLITILRDLSQHQQDSATDAIAHVMSLTFSDFQTQWRQFLVNKKLREHNGIRLPSFKLKSGDALPVDELKLELQSGAARLHTRLGDRLRQRGRTRASAAEYRRALDKAPESPYLLNKLAMVLMEQKRWQLARQHLQHAISLDPDYVTTYTNLGRLYLALPENDQARLALREAIQINPFDPAIHQLLAESYRRLGQAEQAHREYTLFQRLRESQR